MKKFKLISLAVVALAFVAFTAISFKPAADGWEAPAAAAKVKNPTKAGDSADVGSALWAKHCKSCHGKMGKGDGPKAEELDSDMPDLSTAAMQAQSDGSLYYKTTEGKDDMPGFKKKIPSDEDRWLLVNYMRTCK